MASKQGCPSYEYRLRKIQSPADIPKQIDKAKQWVASCKRELKTLENGSPRTEELTQYLKNAESVVRRLRTNMFEIEDRLINESLLCRPGFCQAESAFF